MSKKRVKDALREAEGRFTDAAADSLDAVANATEEATAGLAVAAVEALGVSLGESDPIPEIVNSPRVQSALGNSLHFLGTALAEQAATAITTMSEASADLARLATNVVVKMEEIGQKVATKQISASTGESAIDNYLHALNLYRHTLTNKARVQAYERSTALLASGKSVLFSVLRFGVQAALPTVGNALNDMHTLADDLRSKKA